MVKIIQKDNAARYQCEECGFHYETEDLAKQCEQWCKAHNSCNMEITKHAIKNKS